MDFEREFSHVGYVDRQTLDGVDMDETDCWLSVDVAELEHQTSGSAHGQTMDTSVGKRHLEPLLIPNDDGTGDKRGRRYIYDESPTSHGASAPAGATASAINSVSPQSLSPQTNNSASNTGYVEGEESTEEPKISFMNFKVGCIALFVPMDAGKKTWMAFHHEKPNHFLDPSSLHTLTHRHDRPVNKSRILAKITCIVARRVPGASASASATGAGAGTSYNPYGLAPGTVYFECAAEPVTIIKHC